jgi:hypothetical protein
VAVDTLVTPCGGDRENRRARDQRVPDATRRDRAMTARCSD